MAQPELSLTQDHPSSPLRDATHTALECLSGCVMNEAAGPVIAITFGIKPFVMATGANMRKTLKNAVKNTQVVFVSLLRKGHR